MTEPTAHRADDRGTAGEPFEDGGAAGGGRPPLVWRLLGLALALGAMGASVLFLFGVDDIAGSSASRAPGDFQLLEPLGWVERYGSFRWEPVAPQGGGYRVRVWDLAATDATATLEASPRLEQADWSLDAERASGLPDAIGWEVQAFGPEGESLGQAVGSARRWPR